jgi:hypothetical protein
MLPSTILNGYYYRYKVRLHSEGILSSAKRIQDDPSGSICRAAKHRQVYCVTKRKFFATASPDELKRELVFNEGQDEEEKEDMHRILQCRIR